MTRIPVILFAYARPAHLRRVLACLRRDGVPLIFAFSDGARSPQDETRVKEVRDLLRSVDWAEVRIVERSKNIGLGASVLAGVTEVAKEEDAWLVWEDDLTCVPGTYHWLCEAMRRYANDERVMSVTGWTHPRVRPADVQDLAYLDGRAECWVWGAWRRSWAGMVEETALVKMEAAVARGMPRATYGSDLVVMAQQEERRNIWAVRWLYHHLQHNGLCVRPPWTMVEHIGSDAEATNCPDLGWVAQQTPQDAPLVPTIWPKAVEHPDCAALWRAATTPPGTLRRVFNGVRRRLGRFSPGLV